MNLEFPRRKAFLSPLNRSSFSSSCIKWQIINSITLQTLKRPRHRISGQFKQRVGFLHYAMGSFPYVRQTISAIFLQNWLTQTVYAESRWDSNHFCITFCQIVGIHKMIFPQNDPKEKPVSIIKDNLCGTYDLPSVLS